MDHPDGAGLQRADRVAFDARVRLEFRRAQISCDGGLLVLREMDDALGLCDLASAALCDTRWGNNTVYRLDGLFRQSVFERLAGYEDVNDADRLALDPAVFQQPAHPKAQHRTKKLLFSVRIQATFASEGTPTW